ncbi:cell division protein SepF [Gloeothece verrucosa]|uniref:Cell division protein SepF n=1 Tax=Gloeothece verrucosa (strain PCC 7822) TaxID=497965 RepID=E0U8I3_GLOV7|nr:cell division protein SepF [Gloeothece verrucosa]ADN13729.1 protein of unknown function DUF552 [Gloeothece verrucosa PCC 7822]
MRATQSELSVFYLSHLEEVTEVIDILRERQTVIVNLEQLNLAKTQRVIDWISGCTQAIDGQIIWLGERSFMFAPCTVKVIADESKRSYISPRVKVS